MKMLNNIGVKPEKLALGHILSVRCPRCGAKPKEKCTMSTGHPSTKTHLIREVAAAKVSAPDNVAQTVLRIMKAVTSRGLRVLFQHK